MDICSSFLLFLLHLLRYIIWSNCFNTSSLNLFNKRKLVFILTFYVATPFLQVENVPEDILKIRQEIESEFVGEDQTWSHADGSVSFQIMPFLHVLFILLV